MLKLSSVLSRVRRTRSSAPASGGTEGVSIGLDIGSRTLTLAAIRGTGGGRVEVERIESVQVSDFLADRGLASDPEGLTEEIGALLRDAGIKAPSGAIHVGGGDVMVRVVTMPRAERDEARAKILAGDGVKLPVDAARSQIDVAPLDDDAGATMRALIVAARKDAVELRQRAALDAGFHVEAVDVDAIAGLRTLEYCRPEDVARGLVALVDIGYGGTTIALARDGSPLTARGGSSGIGSLVTAVRTAGPGSDRAEVEKAIRSGSPAVIYPDSFSKWVEGLAEEVRRTVRYAARDDEEATIWLAGGGGQIEGLAGGLGERLGWPVRLFDPLETLPVQDGLSLPFGTGPAAVVAIGLALRDLV